MKGQTYSLVSVLLALLGAIVLTLFYVHLTNFISTSESISSREFQSEDLFKKYVEVPLLHIARGEENNVLVTALVHNPTYKDISYNTITMYLEVDGKIYDTKQVTSLETLAEDCSGKIPGKSVCKLTVTMSIPKDIPLEKAKIRMFADGYPLRVKEYVVRARPLPPAPANDLYVSFQTVPLGTCEDKSTVISVEITNVGKDPVYDVNVVLESNRDGALGKTSISEIRGNSSTVVTFNISFLSPGTHALTARADPDNKVSEVNENNNTASTTLFVGNTSYFFEGLSDTVVPLFIEAVDGNLIIPLKDGSATFAGALGVIDADKGKPLEKIRVRYCQPGFCPTGWYRIVDVTPDGDKNIFVLMVGSVTQIGIVKINLSTLSVKWAGTYTLPSTYNAIAESPPTITYYNGYVYVLVGPASGKFYLMKVNGNNGSVIFGKRIALGWSHPYAGDIDAGEGGVAVILGEDGTYTSVLVFDFDGNLVDKYVFNETSPDPKVGVVFDGNTIFFHGGYVFGKISDGYVLARGYEDYLTCDTAGEGFKSIDVNGDFVYLCSHPNKFFRMSKIDGVVVFAKTVTNTRICAVKHVDGNVFFVGDGYLVKVNDFGLGLSDCTNCGWYDSCIFDSGIIGEEHIATREYNITPLGSTNVYLEDVTSSISFQKCDGSSCWFQVTSLSLSRSVSCCTGRKVTCNSCTTCTNALSSLSPGDTLLLEGNVSCRLSIQTKEDIILDCNGHSVRGLYLDTVEGLLVKSCDLYDDVYDVDSDGVIKGYHLAYAFFWDIVMRDSDDGGALLFQGGSKSGTVFLGNVYAKNIDYDAYGNFARIGVDSLRPGFITIYNSVYEDTTRMPCNSHKSVIDGSGGGYFWFSIQKVRISSGRSANVLDFDTEFDPFVGIRSGLVTVTDVDLENNCAPGYDTYGIRVDLLDRYTVADDYFVEIADVNVRNFTRGIHIGGSSDGPGKLFFRKPGSIVACDNNTDIYIASSVLNRVSCETPSPTIYRDTASPAGWCGTNCVCTSCPAT